MKRVQLVMFIVGWFLFAGGGGKLLLEASQSTNSHNSHFTTPIIIFFLGFGILVGSTFIKDKTSPTNSLRDKKKDISP